MLPMVRLKFCLYSIFFILLLSMSAGATVVTFLNGDQLSGNIRSENATQLVLHHAILGDIDIPKKQILTTTPSLDNSTQTELIEQRARKKKKPGLFGIGFLEGWKRRIALGLKGENGNDTSLELSLAFEASYKDDAHRLGFNSAYFYETEDRKKDTSKGHINIVRDWLLPDTDWFYYAYFRYEQDSFKSWKQRISLSGGPGYDFYNDDTLKLSGRTGLGFSRSWGDENEYDIEGQLGFEWLWKPVKLKSQTLSYQIIVYPILNDFGEYRTWMEGKWRFDLDFFKGLGFECGFEHEYESRKDESLENEEYYDLIYFGRIGLDF